MANYKNKLLLIFLLISHFVLSQTQTIKVYNYDSNGIRSVVPEKIIEIKENRTEIYNTVNGIKEVTPTQIIQDNKIYEVDTNGIQQLLPRYEVYTDSPVLPTFDSNRIIWDGIFNLEND
jgi:hypothetical protein